MPNNIQQAYELTLVLRSQLRDEAAFEELFGLYSPRVRFYVSKMLGDRQSQIDDVLQDVWTTVFRSLPRLRDGGAFHAWLFRIARARVAREFRRARTAPFEAMETCTEPAAEPDSTVDLEALHEQLEQLSPEHREALVLRFIEEMSYDEIGRVTSQPPGTVRSRIHYAKRALRRAWKENRYEIQ